MLILLKNCYVYSPEDQGINDMFIANDKIAYIGKGFDGSIFGDKLQVIDVKGAKTVPGFIDQHVHIIGGGGEGGFATRTPEVMLTDLTLGGTTTVVGVLGTDDVTRHMESLLAKANGLEEEGVTTKIYSGAYPIPTPTITGSVRRDMILIDKVIGTGEIAMSDHRNGGQTKEDFAKLAAEARTGGILSGKAGVLHIHVGPGPKKIDWLFDLLKETDIPIGNYTPTHMNRDEELLMQGIEFTKLGGVIDFTTSSPQIAPGRVQAPEAVAICLEHGVPIDKMTMSSDGNGSMPQFDEKNNFIGLVSASPKTLHACLRKIVKKGILPIDKALQLITINVAKNLKLAGKGELIEGNDADIVILDDDYEVQSVFARGRCMILDKEVKVKGTFEK